MSRPIPPDAVWHLVEPLLPVSPPSPKGGRPRLSPRRALTGILFVRRTGAAWEDRPTELNCGSGMSCGRYLRDWQLDGTGDRIHAVLLDRLDRAGRIDWSRAAGDASSVRAVWGGPTPARTPRTGARAAPSPT